MASKELSQRLLGDTEIAQQLIAKHVLARSMSGIHRETPEALYQSLVVESEKYDVTDRMSAEMQAQVTQAK